MYEIITLPNGVRIAHEKCPASAPLPSASVGVGSRYEKRGEEGSAHFIEHMLFKGTAHSTAAELAGRMDAIGGQVNAFTSRDSTCFYARVLDSHLDEASDILCEMFFDSLFSESDVVNERGVVLEEIDMYRDTPEDIVVEQLMGRIFPGALGKPVLGRPASLNGMTGASLRAFKEREYSPERIVVSVCGSFTEDNLARLCCRFSALAPSRPAACRKSAYTPAVVVKRKATEQNHFCLSFPVCRTAMRTASWQVLSMALGGGMSSASSRPSAKSTASATASAASRPPIRETGMLAISTAVGRDSEEKALALIREEIEKFRQDGITDKELRTARELIKSSIILRSNRAPAA